MKLSEIKSLAESYVDDVIDDNMAIMWANECSDDLASVTKILTYTTIDYNGEDIVNLPDNLYRLLYVYTDKEKLEAVGKLKDYVITGKQMKILNPIEGSKITFVYYRTLNKFTTLDNEPEIPTPFHRLYALWLAFRYWKNYGDERETEADLVNEYNSNKLELFKFYNDMDNMDYYPMKDELPKRNILNYFER